MSGGWRCGAVATTSVRESGTIVKYDVRGTFASGGCSPYGLECVGASVETENFADVVSRILRYLRAASDFGVWRISELRGPVRVSEYPVCCVWSVFRAGGAHVAKNAVS